MNREEPWTEDEIANLRKLWNEGLTGPQIGQRMRRTPASVNGKVKRLRKAEGDVIWPHRESPIKPSAVPTPGNRPRRVIRSTLPPLPSLS